MTKISNKINIGIIYVLLSAILFSTGGLLIKLSTWSPFTINGGRSFFAAIVMYLLLKKNGHVFLWNKRVFLGAIITSVMNTAFVIATKMTSAGNTIVLQFTQPVFIILFLWLFWKQKPSKSSLITCFFVMAGIICFFFDQLTFTGMIGNMFALFSGITYAIVFLIKNMDHTDFESSIVLSFAISAVACIPFYLAESSYSAENCILIILLGVLQMGVPFVLLGKGLNHVSPVTASLISTIEPILNPVLVALFYGEVLGPLSIIGGIIVVSSSTIYNIKQQKETTSI